MLCRLDYLSSDGILTRVDDQVVAVDDLVAQATLVPAGLVGVQDHEALVGGQDKLVAPLEDRKAGRQNVFAPVIVPLDVARRRQDAVRLSGGRRPEVVAAGLRLD